MAIMKPNQKPGFAAGIYSDMTLDGPDIGTLVAVVDRAKNLPNRKAIGKQDPYCAMRLAKEAKKTNTDRRGGQTPRWDQELRFDVHDSPDYYKLKVSIFNDDKKTELIGEAWINLSNVIKLGGGQSDDWHQLNYKSKYAGDIRIELTYYDTREQPQEKKRKDRPQPAAIDSDLEMLLPSQKSLGPREIKRRPLPMSPAETSAPQTRSTRGQSPAAVLPPHIPLNESAPQPIHAPAPLRPRGRSASPLSEQPDDQFNYEYAHLPAPEPFTSQLPRHKNPVPQSYRPEPAQPWQQPLGAEYTQYDQNTVRTHRESYGRNQFQEPEHAWSSYPSPSAIPDEQELWAQQQYHPRTRSVHFHSEPTTPQHSAPIYRPSPISINSDPELVRQQNHYQHSNTSPYGTPFAESPLKQTMSQQELQSSQDYADVPPPLPPKHRENRAKPSRNDHSPSAFIPQPLRIGQKRTSVSDRSPLQALEDGYDAERHTQQFQTTQTPTRHSAHFQSPYRQSGTPEQQIELYDSNSGHVANTRASDPQLARQHPKPQIRRPSYEISHPSLRQQSYDRPIPSAPHDTYHSGQNDGYQPSVEDAPPSPGLHPNVMRKPVGAQAKKLNQIPFGPDAYDVLNPANSPVTNEGTAFQTAEQAKEAARYREVEKIRDLGPIIGNDGREIDPSDHLPSDTWAPEPERKNRPPEHVIHIRNRNETKRPSGARSGPIVIHSRGASVPAAKTSPAQQSSNSPATRTTPSNLAGGRNRLQKNMPTPARPLPNQPYCSPVTTALTSSPTVASSPQQMYYEGQQPFGPSRSRQPSCESRQTSHLDRPPLTEYQVPVGNAYSPRHDSRNSYSKAKESAFYDDPQPKHAQGRYSSPYVEPERRSSYDNRTMSHDRRNSYDNRSDYSYENHIEVPRSMEQPVRQRTHYDDPLAAEMSLIDIGPGRTGHPDGHMNRSMPTRRW